MYYDPLRDKTPYGASAVGEPTVFEFTMPAGERADKVTVIVRMGSDERRAELKFARFDGDASVYSGSVTLPVAGLWYYRFESVAGGRVTYYGRGSGGCAVSGEWLPEWQLTVSKRAYKTPDWAKEGVVYQIFADRFARAGGFTYTVNADGKTATVTGFNSKTAEQLTDGTYRVTIDMIDGYIVTAIADGAFKDVSGVSEVYISNAVTTIGDEAFMNTGNLRLVNIAPGGLSVIGESAFENAGCVQDGDGNWTVNTAGGVDELTMILPLADLTDIQPYAFKTKAIEKFTAVSEEKNRNIMQLLMTNTKLTEGMFMFASAGSGTNRAIIKYTGINETKTMQDSSGKDTEITVRGAQLVAIAGGAAYSNASSGLALGFSYRYFDSQMGLYAPLLATNVFEYEIMEGSVYYGGSKLQLYIGMVSKVHKNAFTDIEDEAPSVNYYNCSYDQHMTIEQVQTQDSEIFEEGWFEGRDNSENTFMADAKVQSSRYPLM